MKVFGHSIPHVMLLHANRLNADLIDALLKIFETKGFRFVTLDEAQADAAYRTPDTFLSKFGPMWGYRWAKARQITVNGAAETEPPAWIVEVGKGCAVPDFSFVAQIVRTAPSPVIDTQEGERPPAHARPLSPARGPAWSLPPLSSDFYDPQPAFFDNRGGRGAHGSRLHRH